jgi:AcrR family transcriptional regulator
MTLTPRKLPAQARSKATVDAILSAATQLLSRGGLAAFNTNAVAERAGVSIGSLYQYFPNKDALMVALIEQQQERQLASLQAAASQAVGLDLATAVRMLVRGAMAHHREDSLLASVIDHEEARLPIDSMLNGYLAKGGELVARLLGEFGLDLPDAEMQRAARTLPALVRAATDAWANLNPPQVEMAEDEAVRAVMGYLTLTMSGSTEVRAVY